MNNGNIEEFDGISLVEWTKDDKIKSLKEFGCNLNNYNPYDTHKGFLYYWSADDKALLKDMTLTLAITSIDGGESYS